MSVAVGFVKKLNSTAFLWAASVVRYRCHICNHIYANTKGRERTY